MDEQKSGTKLPASPRRQVEAGHFPPSFLIGAGISSYQVEGNNTNADWWKWEQLGRLPKSGHAADHYNRFEEDFQIAKEIGLNAVRISIEWSRIEPEEGRWDAVAVEHYKKVLKALKERGLTRMVTLWHWTLPQWLAEKGGFETKEGVEAFARFAWFVAQNLGKEVDLWLTINEPEVYSLASYGRGTHPPFKKSLYLTWHVMENLIAAHKAAYKAIKQALGNVPVGIAKNNAYFEPYRKNNIADRICAFAADRIGNHYFLQKVEKQLDFIGLNYYFYNRIKFDWRHIYREMNLNFVSGQLTLDDQVNRTDMGWVIYPEGIYHLLLDLKAYKKPIYITENGLADAADNRRPKFIRETLAWLSRAIDQHVDLRGYFHWALIDNYEWEHGFAPKFGLVEIDYGNQQRKVRPSALIFSELAAERENINLPSKT